uniref:Nuclear pore complex protein n=1 Tax=Trichobilharzia regenti TaxID=157069 RepID=A0AA85JBZ0_TRIRE|nr:unnamed protein product [Trichobilharzia regenti]
MNSWSEVNNDFKKTANTTQLMDEEPEIFDGSSLYSHFCNVWQNSQTSLSEIPIKYGEACYKTVRRLPKIFTKLSHRRGLPNIRSVTEMINLERNTWSLISNIYLDRFQCETKTGTTESSDLSNFNHSEKEIIRLLYEKDSELRETQILIDWLELLVREQIEEVAERYECLFNQTTAWENTAHLLNYLPKSELTKRRLIKELHPDVVTLTGNELDQKDQIDDDRYVNYLFLCLRGGDLHRAQLLCTQRGEYWRAISLEGWRPFHYSGFIESESKEMEKAFNEDEELGESGPFYMKLTVEGNPTRILYKSVCWWNSENVELRSFERAIYATLSGNLDVLTQILPASWTDQTWAHCRALVEARVDSSLRSLLNTGPRADTLAVTGKTTKHWPLDGGLTLPDSAWTPGDWTLSDAFARVDARLGWSAIGCLEKCSSNSSSNLRMQTVIRSAVNDFLMDDTSCLYTNDDGFRNANANNNGSDIQSPSVYAIVYCIFYAVQQTVMLRNYDSFLATLANIMPKLVCYGLGDGVVPEIGPIQPPDFSRVGNIDQVVCHTLRFLTHFVLFLKSAESDIQDVACSEIIKAYLCFLMVIKNADLVAYYTSALHNESLRIQWYSWFSAETIQPSEREHCLSLAVTYGFDIVKLTRSIVKLLRQRMNLPGEQQYAHIISSLRNMSSEYFTGLLDGDIDNKNDGGEIGRLSDIDKQRIISLDWLFYNPSQRGEALCVANSLLRLFITFRSLNAAKKVISKLPTGTLEQAKVICEKSGSPASLVNTIREFECYVLYLEGREAFADWYEQVHTKRPTKPSALTTAAASNLTHTTYGPRGLAQRLALEESKKEYLARLERWRYDTRLDTQNAAEKLIALLTYPKPGWLIDISQAENSQSQASTAITPPTTEDNNNNNNNDNNNNNIREEQQPDLYEMKHAEVKVESDVVAGEDKETVAAGDEEDIFSGLGESCATRQLQMSILREACLSETVFLILRLYQTAGLHQKCIELSNLIADNEHGLFKLLSVDQLKSLLHHICQSIQHFIDNELDPLGYSSAAK